MTSAFKNIMIPVDFSINTEIAVKKAIELADQDTNIYLLYIREAISGGFKFSMQRLLSEHRPLFAEPEVEKKINQWKECIKDSSNSKKVFSRIVSADSVQQSIADEARKLSIDLIIVGKKSNHSWLPFLNTVIPNQLSKEAGTVVLTLKPGGIYSKVKTMVVPVTSETAINKLAVIYAICKKFPVRIHLLAFINYDEKEGENYASTLLRLYQSLRATLNCPVEYTVLKSHNKAKAILNYSEKYNADIILVNAVTETRIGWPNKHISDVLPAGSKLQVWAV